MTKKSVSKSKLFFKLWLKHDLPAGFTVFFVALPLCLGISLASGAPYQSGLLAGMVGGILVSILSGSQLSVSGPAAGLSTVVAAAIISTGSFSGFLASLVIAGLFQIALGLIKAG
ncbi:MAG: SulP family inorganic anion transporter, partial [Bacteroidia bacterium]|nr:SulP family inorganic anion transporter [Bacteroidia bacterium]